MFTDFDHSMAFVNGERIHYVRAGEGDPVVLLHGWPQTWYMWRKVIPTLAERYTVIAPDLRGFGQSSKPETGYDKRTVATDVYELVRSLGFEKVFLVGHDLYTSPARLGDALSVTLGGETRYWRPLATTRPPSTTRMRSAPRTVASRWAITIVVRPFINRSRACWTSRSLWESRLLVASSRSRIGASFKTARAIATRWRWPPERVMPFSPSIVS